MGTKYGELIVLGYNGSQSILHTATKHSTKFELTKKPKPNGIVKNRYYTVDGPMATVINKPTHHSVTYTLGRNKSIIVEYIADDKTDMFQIGRSSESQIDFTVVDTWLGSVDESKMLNGKPPQSTISRYACRILVKRDSDLDSDSGNKTDDRDQHETLVYAAGFDTSRNIFLGIFKEKATKWHKKNGEIDGLTTNGVLILHPKKDSTENDDRSMYIWREVSVDGDIYALRETRSSSIRGQKIDNESNALQDGTLIDLCGATLLYRSVAGLSTSPTKLDLETALDKLNAGRPQCPVNLNTLIVPRQKSNSNLNSDRQPYVYLQCGHIQGHHAWGHFNETQKHKCPMCHIESDQIVQVCMGMEPAFHLGSLALNFAFNPCGHIASERTVEYWSRIPMPHGTNQFHPVCPFCSTMLNNSKPFVKLIFQDNCS